MYSNCARWSRVCSLNASAWCICCDPGPVRPAPTSQQELPPDLRPTRATDLLKEPDFSPPDWNSDYQRYQAEQQAKQAALASARALALQQQATAARGTSTPAREKSAGNTGDDQNEEQDEEQLVLSGGSRSAANKGKTKRDASTSMTPRAQAIVMVDEESTVRRLPHEQLSTPHTASSNDSSPNTDPANASDKRRFVHSGTGTDSHDGSQPLDALLATESSAPDNLIVNTGAQFSFVTFSAHRWHFLLCVTFALLRVCNFRYKAHT